MLWPFSKGIAITPNLYFRIEKIDSTTLSSDSSMSTLIIEQENFHNINAHENPLKKRDYENCTFTNCDFSGTDLSHINFIDCSFDACNLSSAKLSNTGLKTLTFKNCKLLGVLFNECNPFLLELHFEHCMLNLSSFYNLKLKNTSFQQCSLQEVDFSSTDLTNASFDHTDLTGATFDRSILDKADFRTANHYTIDPEKNSLKKARFSNTGLSGLLHKYKIIID